MIKCEHIEVFNIEAAIRGMDNKTYRKTKNGYEVYVSEKSKTINLGTYSSEQEAKDALFHYRINRFLACISIYGLNICVGKCYNGKYVVFPDGNIFNLHGRKINGSVNRDGYVVVNLNDGFHQIHRIVALTHLPIVVGKEYINHKDGNKQNNNVDNLEWCTKSENSIHSYANRLQTKTGGQYGTHYTISESDIDYVRTNIWRLMITQQNMSQFFGLSRAQIQDRIYGNVKDEFTKDIQYIWKLKANYVLLGQEINRCSSSVKKIINKHIIKEDKCNDMFFICICDELRKCHQRNEDAP